MDKRISDFSQNTLLLFLSPYLIDIWIFNQNN